MEFRVSQFGCQVSVISKQKDTGSVSVQTANRIDTFCTCIADNIDHRVTLLRIIGGGDSILRFVEKDIYLALTADRLVMETDIIRRQHFGAQIVYGLAVDGNHACLDKIICLTTGTDTCISEVFIETDRFCRILMLLTINLLFMTGIDSGVTFRFTSERAVRTLCALAVRTLRTGLTVTGKMRTGFAVTGKMRTGFSVSGKTRTSRALCPFTVKTRSRTTLTFIVGIVVVHQFRILNF